MRNIFIEHYGNYEALKLSFQAFFVMPWNVTIPLSLLIYVSSKTRLVSDLLFSWDFIAVYNVIRGDGRVGIVLDLFISS